MRQRRYAQRAVRRFAAPLLILAVLTLAAPPVRADDPKAELEQASDKLKFIQEQKVRATNEFQRVNWLALEAEQQLVVVERDLTNASRELDVISGRLVTAEQELARVEAEVNVTQARFDQRQALLAARIRTINEQGRVNYLGVLLGSNSFADFISRYDMLRLIVKRDAELFDHIRKDKKELEAKQAEATLHRNQLSLLKQQAESRRVTIESKRAEQQVVARNLDSRKRELRAQLVEFDRLEEAMQEQIAEIQRRLAKAAGRFAPIAPVRRIHITDNFGPRLHPILGVWRPHNGTDFAANYGDPVLAIEDGTVIVAEWNDAFGWLVVIDHGGGIASWYGHSSQLLVRSGQNVNQGHQIAKAGSTGWSTGPHVHLEVRFSGKAEDPMDYIK
jgi:murein DD-endopeptidase MepM/ murein hydrolase activator NlpD